jgi:DNA-binding LacI/PurR family transcriptional regulator
MARTNLSDIARVCRMDISTVSRGMRGDPRVAAASRKQIQATAQRLGYQPNLLARNLAGGRTRTIWLIIPSLDAAIDCRIVRDASHYANARDYTLFAALHDSDRFGASEGHGVAHYTQMIERAGQGLADGAVILPRRYMNDADLLRDLVHRRFPLVFLDNYVEELPVSVVTTDNEGATRELVRRCVEAGAKEAVLLFEEPNPVARTRLAAAEAALRELGIPYLDINQTPANWTPAQIGSSVAILGSAQSYLHQFAVRHAANLNGRHLIFGVFDDWVGEPAPAETVVVAVQDSDAVARRALDELIARIEKKPTGSPRITRVPVLEYRTLRAAF